MGIKTWKKWQCDNKINNRLCGRDEIGTRPSFVNSL